MPPQLEQNKIISEQSPIHAISSTAKISGIPKVLTITVLFLTALSSVTSTTVFAFTLYQTNKSFSSSVVTNQTVVQDPTQNWQTYTNSQYGFTFKYPSDWEIDKKASTNNQSIITLTKCGPRQTSKLEVVDCANVSISIATSSATKKWQLLSGDKTFSAYGFNGLISKDTGGGTVDNELLYASHAIQNDTSIIIEWSRSDFYLTNDFSYTKYLLPILSTFKFISPQASTTINTSNWKTYTNDQYGFSFKYPSADKVGFENESIVITSPLTQQMSDNTSGELTDTIWISPRENQLGSILPEPVVLSEQYFNSQNVRDWFNSYLGKVTIDDRIGFQLHHAETSDAKYTIFQNFDKTYFVIGTQLRSDSTISEPYDTILETLKFTK